ncbi:MAG: glycosyltransferase family 4 protein [Thermoprotei archaeon]
MKVALIAQSFSGAGGTARYAQQLLLNLRGMAIPVEGRASHNPFVSYLSSSIALYARWKYLEVKPPELVHLTNAYAPFLLPRRSSSVRVSTWHDLFPLIYGGLLDRQTFSVGMLNYSRSDALIFNSEETMLKLKAFLESCHIKKVSSSSGYQKPSRVIWLGVPDAFMKRKPWDGPRKDLAFVGVLHNRHKDLLGLLTVFAEVRASRACRLHLFTPAYDAGLALTKAKEMGIHRDLVFHQSASDEQLAIELSKVSALLHVVRAEGFGLTILEALSVGTPVLLPKEAEVPGVTAKYASRVSFSKLADSAVRALDRGAQAPPEAVAYARSFTWSRTAQETLKFYEELLDQKTLKR